MATFLFKSYSFDRATGVAQFKYGFDDGKEFTETITYQPANDFDEARLDNALFLAFVLVGTSYFKTFPTADVRFEQHPIDEWQAHFFNKVYQEGLSQFAFENNLERSNLAHFTGEGEVLSAGPYGGEGVLALQSGGKDSLLTASLLAAKSKAFTPWYISSSEHYPDILNQLGESLVVVQRALDRDALIAAHEAGGLNGHVPVTYIVQSLALIQAILLNKNEVLVSIAHEGEEPHAHIGDLSVSHQWSKTWSAEQDFATYVTRYISPDIRIGSPLRRYSELRVAELFVDHAWQKFGRRFSSCNRANYMQGSDNSELHWCGECPKCANSFLLFAPFVEAEELKALFAGQDLFEKPALQETFKGLLGVDDVMKPFECVGEIDELRYAYHQAQVKGGYVSLSFEVPVAEFDYLHEYPAQDWAEL